jgi:hypothetical protein
MSNKVWHDVVTEFVLPMCIVSVVFGLIAFWPFPG